MEIAAIHKYEQLKIYINNTLHLHIKLLNLIGFQSWIHGESEYYIQYTFKDGTTITTAYGEKEKWVTVLGLLDKHITVIG
jgi:hypothetical protein